MQAEIIDETDIFVDNERSVRVNAQVLAQKLPARLRHAVQLAPQSLLHGWSGRHGSGSGGGGGGGGAGAAAAAAAVVAAAAAAHVAAAGGGAGGGGAAGGMGAGTTVTVRKANLHALCGDLASHGSGRPGPGGGSGSGSGGGGGGGALPLRRHSSSGGDGLRRPLLSPEERDE
jgi:hypothetical protein